MSTTTRTVDRPQTSRPKHEGAQAPGVGGDASRTSLERARRAAGLSQRQLSAASGVSANTIRSAERGTRSLQPRTMRALAAALGADVEAVFPVDLRVRPFNPQVAVWPPPPDLLNQAVQAYRATGDALGAAELLDDGTHEATIRKRLNDAGCLPRPRGGSRSDGVMSLAAWARKKGATIHEAVAAAQVGRVPGAFLEDLDDPVIGVRWAVYTPKSPTRR